MSRKVNQFIRNRLSEATTAEALRAQERRARLAHTFGKETLYRYRSLLPGDRDYTVDIIAKHRVYLSSPARFNDPFDCAPAFILGGDPQDHEFVRKLLRHEEAMQGRLSEEETMRSATAPRVDIEQLAGAIERTIRDDMARNARVLCLSGEHLHPLCWSHYAGNHNGICLHFSTRQKSIFRGASKVLYQKDRKPIIIDGVLPSEDTYEKTALTKAEFWSYEDEYRVVLAREGPMSDQFDSDGCIRFPPEVLCGITLGMHISDRDRDLIVQMARASSPQIPVWQAGMHPKEYWMVEDRIA